MYIPLMKYLKEQGGFTSFACNQRGYSPTASPENVEEYDYNILKADVLDIAAELGYEQFHLVAHDHGAVLGWTVAQESDRVVSFTSLSIPHPDVFSDALYGPNADRSQQMASQYFDMFTRDNSASIKGNFWYMSLGLTSGRWKEYDDKYSDYGPSDFQKALWWYNGAQSAGKMAGPPAFTVTELTMEGQYSVAFLRGVFGMPDEEVVDGIEQTNKVGMIDVPTLFVCGKNDPAILCDNEYSYNTENYVSKDYLHLVVDCEHDLTSCGGDEQEKVNRMVWQRIRTA
ncbi:hypothetical protein TrVE_jg6319 [Triparma verrucosa]|nr:hypothetical protein TrVE_jg6319 [Triparma verrucosa]